MTFVKRHSDIFISALMIALTLAYAALYIDFKAPPLEDAAMLMRYADHLGHGYGVVWNIGEHPVDGATDFLFMAAAAGLIKLGVAIGRSVRLLGFAAHLATVLLVYWVNRRVWGAGRLISFVCALYLAVGAGLSYVAAFFGTTFFALFATVTWALALLLIRDVRVPVWMSWAFALAGLITGLIRPEGVILAGLMMVAVIVARGWGASRKTVAVFAGVFLVLGGAYFLWRWSYFGYPLPNPYYVKGEGALHGDSFWESLRYLLQFAGPFALAFLLGLRSAKTGRLTAAFIIPLLLFDVSFALISNDTNFGGRFQYALWPLVLVSWYPLVRDVPREMGWSWKWPVSLLGRLAWITAIIAAAIGLVRYGMGQGFGFASDGRYDAAKILSDYEGKGYVIATSEAGLLPLYSNWTAVDTWGLNDEWIAHHGEVTPQYLDERKPELIVFHAYFSPLVPPKIIPKNMAQDWFRMTITLKDYAESHGYVLAAAFGDSPYEAHYYYVHADFPDSAKIVRQIAGMRNYTWAATGKKALNYASVQP